MRKCKKCFSQLLLGLFFISITLVSCEKDLYHEHLHQKKNKNEITFEQFIIETGLTDFKKTIKIRPNVGVSEQYRNADGSYELSDFDISVEYIKKLEYSGEKSYTFRVYPKVEEALNDNSIFNLTFYRINDEWKIIVIEFIPTPENYEKIESGLTEQIEGTAKMLYHGDYTTNTAIGGCETVGVVRSNCEGCPPGQCDFVYGENGCVQNVCYIRIVYLQLCSYDWSGGGDGSGPGDGSSPGDGGGGSNGSGAVPILNYNPITNTSEVNPYNMIANVLPGLAGETEVNDPCLDLRMNTDRLSFREKLNTLNKPLYFDKDHESAFIDVKNGNSRTFTYVESPIGQNNHIDIFAFPSAISFMHVHNNDYTIPDNYGDPKYIKTGKVPSIRDVMGFLSKMQLTAMQQGIPANQSYALTITSYGIYSFKLKVNDYSSIISTINNLTTNGFNWETFNCDYEKRSRKIIYNDNIMNTEKKKKLETLLLKKLKESGLDQIVGLYEGTSLGNNIDSDVSWKEKHLDENNEVTERPCNN